MWRKTRLAAFTLLECLVALVILSGSLLVFEGLSKLIAQEIQHQSHAMEKDWLVFSSQLRSEWSSVTLVKVEGDRVYVDKSGQGLAYGKSRSDDFRKTNDKGQGYQPMLYQVQSARISQKDGLIQIDFTFTSGEERTFVYLFEKAG